MRRELRRHPVQAKPQRGSNRPVRAPRINAATRTAGAPPAARSRIRGVPAILQPAWFQEILRELKKVQWPTLLETRNLTFVVLVVGAILGVFLGGLDAGFNWLIEHSLLR